MVIEKSTDCYTLIENNLDYNILLNLYDKFKNELTELDLSKKFKQYNYYYSDKTNPLWKTLEKTDHWYLKKILTLFGLNEIETVINLSDLPAGFELGPHKDIARRTVLLIPITGVNSPIIIKDEPVIYANSVLLLDSTSIHSVPITKENRVTLQFAFRQKYDRILSIVNKNIQ